MRLNYRFSLPINSSLPLRDQISESISAAIANNVLAADKPLPSCRVLAEQLGVSRNTVHASYLHLVDLGLLTVKDRSGYYVTKDSLLTQQQAMQSGEGDELAPYLQSRLCINTTKPSSLRKVEHPQDWDKYPYPFVYNQIDPRIFPLVGWRECMRQALNVQRLPVWSGDSDGADSSNLLEQLQQRLLNYRGLQVRKEEILITSGAQNALFILGLLFREDQRSVAIEDPGYPEARSAFQLTGNRIKPVGVGSDGLKLEEIPSDCGLVYVTPSHQFPTAATLPLERRQELLNLACEKQFLIVEDDYEAEMNYVRDIVPPIRALDQNGSVIYVGSLSKALSPGLRLGFMVAHPDIIREAKALRRAMLRHPPTLLQDAMALFLGLGHQDAHLKKLHRRYKTRWSEMRAAISEHLPDLKVGSSTGGTCFWVDGPKELNTDKLEISLRNRGVLFDNGSTFFFDPKQGQGKFRLGFASVPAKEIQAGVKIIGEEISNLL